MYNLNEESVDQSVLKIVSETSGINEKEINIDDNLKNDLGIEAGDLEIIINKISKVFEITLPELTTLELTTNTLAIEVVKQLMS